MVSKNIFGFFHLGLVSSALGHFLLRLLDQLQFALIWQICKSDAEGSVQDGPMMFQFVPSGLQTPFAADHVQDLEAGVVGAPFVGDRVTTGAKDPALERRRHSRNKSHKINLDFSALETRRNIFLPVHGNHIKTKQLMFFLTESQKRRVRKKKGIIAAKNS